MKKKDKTFKKKELLRIRNKIEKDDFLTPDEAEYILGFKHNTNDSKLFEVIKKLGLPISILFGLFIVLFPEVIEKIISILPTWLDLSERLAQGLDYIWGIIGNPIEKTHLIYHMPNILLYSFGIAEVRNIINAIRKKSWLDKVLAAKETLQQKISTGQNKWDLKKGHSILFIGDGDYIGQEIAIAEKSMALVLSSKLPNYTNLWNHYVQEGSYKTLKETLLKSGAADAGEYVLFPIIDTSIFLPGENDYDISPHKLDLLVQNIRSVENEMEWTNKLILIVGDKYHHSVIKTSSKENELKDSKEEITLETMTKRNPKVKLIDPTDVVLKKILELSNGRRILFRASELGLSEYKNRFYKRIEELGYRENPKEIETFTVGYDVMEDQTEQQSIANRERGYYPVVLSKDVLDSLLKNGYRKDQLIYVPELVISTIRELISQQ